MEAFQRLGQEGLPLSLGEEHRRHRGEGILSSREKLRGRSLSPPLQPLSPRASGLLLLRNLPRLPSARGGQSRFRKPDQVLPPDQLLDPEGEIDSPLRPGGRRARIQAYQGVGFEGKSLGERPERESLKGCLLRKRVKVESLYRWSLPLSPQGQNHPNPVQGSKEEHSADSQLFTTLEEGREETFQEGHRGLKPLIPEGVDGKVGPSAGTEPKEFMLVGRGREDDPMDSLSGELLLSEEGNPLKLSRLRRLGLDNPPNRRAPEIAPTIQEPLRMAPCAVDGNALDPLALKSEDQRSAPLSEEEPKLHLGLLLKDGKEGY